MSSTVNVLRLHFRAATTIKLTELAFAMQLIDIGANLSHESFSHDLEQVIADAKQADVAHIILTGTDMESSQAAATLATQERQFFSATAGFHPHIASTWDDTALQAIGDLAQSEQVIAVGETGLDFNRNFSSAEQQLFAFEQQLQLAVSVNKPVFLHQRDAHTDFIKILRKYRGELVGGVVHCFTDTEEALRDYLELDMYIGITGWVCDERRGKPLQQLIPQIPAQRLLIETDAPYLLPRTLRPKPKTRRNEPKYLPEVVNTLSQLTGRSPQQLADETTSNAKELFGITL